MGFSEIISPLLAFIPWSIFIGKQNCLVYVSKKKKNQSLGWGWGEGGTHLLNQRALGDSASTDISQEIAHFKL